MTTSLQKTQSFSLKGSMFALSVLQLHEPVMQLVADELKNLVEQSPTFFKHAPLIIDIETIKNKTAQIDFASLCTLMRELDLVVVGIRGGEETHHAAAMQNGLAVFPADKSASIIHSSAEEQQFKDAAKHHTPQHSRLITHPIRSGQQVYARNGDLVIIGAVNEGAEVLADGNIHIYGALRGKALAGINGDEDARIYCLQMDAQLLSIAGYYMVNDGEASQLMHTPTPCQVYLENQHLHIQAFKG